MLEELLLSLIPPSLEQLQTLEDWAVASDYWEEHCDDRQAELCRRHLCIDGPYRGHLFSRPPDERGMWLKNHYAVWPPSRDSLDHLYYHLRSCDEVESVHFEFFVTDMRSISESKELTSALHLYFASAT